MANNPTLMSMPICRDAEKNTIPITDNGTTGKFSEQYGWQGINSLPLSAGGKAVERLDFNGVLALLGGIDYMTQRGYTFEYDNTLPYVVGCIVIDPLDGKTYRCIHDVPAGAKKPSKDTTNWVVYDIADYVGGALRSKAYNVGDTSTLVGIPAGYFLECTTAGTTGATAPVITTVTKGQTISDGTVVWTIRKSASTQDLTAYLPLSGGALTGQTIQRNVANDQLNIFGGNGINNGGSIILAGNAVTDEKFQGLFKLRAAKNINTAYALVGKPDGTLVWGTNNVFNDLGGSAIVAKAFTGGGGYIKRASGEIIQSGIIDSSGWTASGGMYYKNITFPISFTSGTTFSFVALAQQISGVSTNVHVTQCNYGGSTIQIWATAACQFRYIAFGY